MVENIHAISSQQASIVYTPDYQQPNSLQQRFWRLDCDSTTIVFVVNGKRMVQIMYWGKKLSCSEHLPDIYASQQRDFTGAMADSPIELTICPLESENAYFHPGLLLRSARGERLHPQLLFSHVHNTENQLVFVYTDSQLGITYSATFVLYSHGIIAASSRIQSHDNILVEWCSAPSFPVSQYTNYVIECTGRWCGEFQFTKHRWSAGARCRDNRTGRSGHEHFPGMLVTANNTTNTQGECFAFQYAYAGGHSHYLEELSCGLRQVQFANLRSSDDSCTTCCQSSVLYACYADNGINGCAVVFQRHIREHLVCWPKPKARRPVHYNCWESVYFDHNLTELKAIATQVAQLGAERFVLDDGWFANRDDDTQSLGDWWVDNRSYPQGLDPLIWHVQSQGMTFGLWLEPEMVNANSRCYREHPDWILARSHQQPARNQYVLDMSNGEVCEFLYMMIAALLTKYAITYIKWDHNRAISLASKKQIQGTIGLLCRLRQHFPQVEIESCASGGGRMDMAMLHHCQRVWLSDSNDAIERLAIQHNASVFLPSMLMGSHIGAKVCHTSGRMLDISLRAWTAAQRHFGFEMDPRELNQRELKIIKRVCHWWKANRNWMFHADVLRLDYPDDSYLGEIHLANDGSRFVVFLAKLMSTKQILPRPMRLCGLDTQCLYRITLINRDELYTTTSAVTSKTDATQHISPSRLSRGNQSIKFQSVQLSGSVLMNQGLQLPWTFPQTIMVFEGQRL